MNKEEIFQIDFSDKSYPCKRVEKSQGVFYVIQLETRMLVLTKFVSNNEQFWTAIPADTKLNHIVAELGAKIDNHFNNQHKNK